ncbi:MAG: FmdB family transcriptional regulator [Actinomycetota bacterium]|jgi:putative FmdB family regulatory protein|nr:FmdB family transcriptional regulator [Actinomycetota bacterium]
MPTYEYACTSCGHHVEIFQSFSDEPLSTCPSCGGSLRKVFGSIGIVLKGSGFYRTDNRNGSSAKSTSGEKAAGENGKDKADAPKKDAASSSSGGDSAAAGSSTPTSAPISSGASGASSAAAAAG